MPSIRLVLASASPRRVALLRDIGIEVAQRPTAIREAPRPGESPRAHVLRLAEAKARAAAGDGDGQVVLGADTVVVFGGEILGKPRDDDHARCMLGRLAGRAHEVLTGVFALRPATGAASAAVAATRVWFRALEPAWIHWYVATGEPRDKAGAYGIQGRGALLVERIEGSWPNVVGLPVELLPALLSAVGVDALELLRGGERND